MVDEDDDIGVELLRRNWGEVHSYYINMHFTLIFNCSVKCFILLKGRDHIHVYENMFV